MQQIMCPDALSRHRSEQLREYNQARWFSLTRKLLTTSRGPFSMSLPATGASAMTTASTPCPHREEDIIEGANQYGRWKKCLGCNTQISFDRYGPSNPALAVPKSVPKIIQEHAAVMKAKAKPSPENSLSRAELQSALSQHSQELMSSLSQALGPLIQSQVMLQEQMGYVMSSSSATTNLQAQQGPCRCHSFQRTRERPTSRATRRCSRTPTRMAGNNSTE